MKQIECVTNPLSAWRREAPIAGNGASRGVPSGGEVSVREAQAREARMHATRRALAEIEPDIHSLVDDPDGPPAATRILAGLSRDSSAPRESAADGGGAGAAIGAAIAFEGAPVAIKEIIAVDGLARRCGSQLPPGAFARGEASVVARLRRIGLIPAVHSVSTEFAYFHPGPTRNPRNPDHTPGGSSSGSAAAVAAGIVPVAVGTQTIGSVIRPASYCGVVGYKPTFGVLPRDGVHPVSRTVDHLGFFTQDLFGMELLASALGLVARPPASARGDSPSEAATFAVRVCVGPYADQAGPEMRGALNTLVARLAESGIEVAFEELFGDCETLNQEHRVVMARDFYHAHEALFARYGDLYRSHSLQLFEEGRATTVADYERALDRREREIATFDGRAASVERDVVWLSPAAPGAAPRGLESTGSPVLNLPWTSIGAPALTLPMGRDPATALPLGVQIAAPRGRDDLLFAAARRIAAVVPEP